MLRTQPASSELFEVQIRKVGIASIALFGEGVVIPSLAQMIFFLPFYLEEAKKIGERIAVNVSIKHFYDGIFEQGHQISKMGFLSFCLD